MTTQEMCSAWLTAKQDEQRITEQRRAIEDELSRAFDIKATDEGTKNFEVEAFVVKAICTPSRKVDGELVYELAKEHGLEQYTGTLFRWKPELSLTAWKNTDKSITDVFASAITTKASRPSYTIVRKEE